MNLTIIDMTPILLFFARIPLLKETLIFFGTYFAQNSACQQNLSLPTVSID